MRAHPRRRRRPRAGHLRSHRAQRSQLRHRAHQLVRQRRGRGRGRASARRVSIRSPATQRPAAGHGGRRAGAAQRRPAARGGDLVSHSARAVQVLQQLGGGSAARGDGGGSALNGRGTRTRQKKDLRLLHRAAPAARNGRSPLPAVDTRQLPACAARHRADERARARGGAKPSARRNRRHATKNARTRAAQPRAAAARARRRTLPTRRAGRVRGTRLRKPAREGMKLSNRRLPKTRSRPCRGRGAVRNVSNLRQRSLAAHAVALGFRRRGRGAPPEWPGSRKRRRALRGLWLHGGTAACAASSVVERT